MEEADAAGTVESGEAVSGSQEAIEAAFDPAERTLSPSRLSAARPPAVLDLVVMHGHFEDMDAKVPAGAPTPQGTVMSFVVNQGTGRVAATYVGDTAPDLSATYVEPLQGTAPVKAQSASVKRKLGRPRAHVATWGNNCRFATAYHCYVVATENMKGAEEVYGVDDETDTDYIDVPGWQHGYFVDNEVWAWAHVLGPSTWTEIGQQAGEYKGCCNTWWFYAFENGTEGYRQFVDAPYVSEVPESTGNHYMMKTAGGGIWCWYFGTGEELKACAADFAWQATQLEAGGEIATEEKPVFDSSTNNSAEWTNYTWHTWNFATVAADTSGLCWSALNGAPGNIYYDTCGK
jgi:hypothetical protein